MQLVLMYFDPIMGPEIFSSYPDSILEQTSKKMEGFFDLDMSENFFEVLLIKENKKITNLYFEIDSNWARGKVEMLMLSIISEKDYSSELSCNVLQECSSKIKSAENIFKAFYTKRFTKIEDPEINLKKDELYSLLINCYNHLERNFRNKSQDDKIIKKFKRFKW